MFIVGGADTQVALKQTGMQPGDIAVVSGTTSPVVYMTSSHYCDPRQRVWIDAGLDGDYLVEMNPGVTGLNYQRLKHILARDMSFEELEERYRSKAAFSCTASFSSLLFYERRSLRNGGFFTRSPADIALDRLEMLWAVLADIACSVYEQLYRLIELTGSRADFIRCCGGGFRSQALCQMLADLSGMELRLYLGYEQATVQGLVRICSQALGETAACAAPCPIAVIRPGNNPLIRDYHKVWLENRSRNN